MFQILIIILIVVLIVLGGIMWYQHNAAKQVQGLLSAQQELVAKKVSDQLKDGEKMQLTGDAKKEFDSLEEQYHQKIVPQLKRIADNANQLLKDTKTTKLLTISGAVNDLRDQLATVTANLNKVQTALQRLQQQNKDHQRAIGRIKERYNKFHQQLNEKSFEYGDSAKKLNEELADLEKRYDKFVAVTSKGDQDAAQEILAELQQDNEQFAAKLKRIPKLYKPLVTEFPDQLTELKQGYATLVKDHYCFTEQNLDQQIDQLENKLEATIQQFNDLHLDVVEQANRDLSEQIDHLYGVMQKEIDAKPEALHLLKVMLGFTQHAQQQNNELITELDRLNLSYTLNNNEIETARELNEQIKTITKEFEEDSQAVQNHTAIFSQILTRQRANESSLTDIEKSQEKVNDEVAKLQTDEQRAKKMLQRYSIQIHTIHRQVDRLNLPGVSQDYLDYFFGVSDEIKKLAEELNQYKINMEEVTKQLIMVEADLETLQDKTKDLRDSAELTERLQQYANRYADNQQVEKAAKKANDLFNQFDYTGSLEAIATALEEVEPGSYKRIEDSYYHEIGEA